MTTWLNHENLPTHRPPGHRKQPRTPHRKALVVLIVAAELLWLSPFAMAAERDRDEPVSRELANSLEQARAAIVNNQPAQAVTILNNYAGPDHYLRQLLLGHGWLKQGDSPRARGAYLAALEKNPDCHSAGIALAQFHAREDNWPRTLALLAEHIDSESPPADQLALYAQAAWKTRDPRLARILTDRGMQAFPDADDFRRLDLAMLMAQQQWHRAGQALDRLLAKAPDDAALWQDRAVVYHQLGQTDHYVAATHAAMLCDPDNLRRQVAYNQALMAADQSQAMLDHGRSLLAGPLREQAMQQPALMEQLICTAESSHADELLDEWLGLVPEEHKTPAIQLADARLRLRREQPARAIETVRTLVQQGETSASLCLWAGSLAESLDRWTLAESFYKTARSMDDPQAELAPLYLARLYILIDRPDSARERLHQYLTQHPTDPTARALLHYLNNAKTATASTTDYR